MSIRRRLFITFLFVTGFGFYLFVNWVTDDLRPRYLETMEESMVDVAILLASQVELQVKDDTLDVESLRASVTLAQKQPFNAKIYDLTKTGFNMRVYVVDRKGVVLFDSEGGTNEGKNYLGWNDVIRTLDGVYGARTTRDDPLDPKSSVLYVAAPIRKNGEIIGALTVAKPSNSVSLFLRSAKKKIIFVAILASIAVVLMGYIITHWITHPIRRLITHARKISDGKRPGPLKLGKSDIGSLGQAFEEMRDALEGKQYIEHYVQTLTHEMKSPLSAIQGAAELLEEDMPPEDRKRFIRNIRNETERMRSLVDRLLNLAALEGRKGLRDVEQVRLKKLVDEVARSLEPMLSAKHITFVCEIPDELVVECERFLLRQCLVNVIANSIEFVSAKGNIRVTVRKDSDAAVICVEDDGCGIPEYALDRVYERFYSLQRPETRRKSSGIGLTFVLEAIELHNGSVQVANRPENGVAVTLVLPLTQTCRDS